MKNYEDKQFLRYLYKWLFLIFLIFIIISIFLNLYIFYNEERYYSKIVESGQSEKLNYLAKQLEDEVGKLKVINYLYLKGDAILDLYTFYDYSNSAGKNVLITELSNRCMEITNTNSFIKNASFLLKERNLQISSSGYAPVEDDVFEKYVTLAKNSEIISRDENGQAYIIGVLNINYLEEKWDLDNIAGVFVIELDLGAFESEMRYAKLTDMDILFMTDLDGEHIIANTSPVEQLNMGIDVKDKKELKLGNQEYQIFSSNHEDTMYRIYYLQHQEKEPFYHNRLTLNLILFGILIMISIIFCTNLFYNKVFKPLEVLLVEAFGQVKKSNFSYRIPVSENQVFSNLYGSFNHMAERIDILVSQELKQEILINQANLKHLQAQINPHFMYNSYFTLYRLIKAEDKESSLYVCENLGGFFKYITKDTKMEMRLVDEVLHAQSYTAIQSYRYKGRMNIVFDELPLKYHEIIVPRLIIQPIIENVFKYVVDEIYDEDEILLKINYFEEDQGLVICIENSGNISQKELDNIRGKIYTTEIKDDITALININQRLDIYFNQEHSIKVLKSKLGGLEVHIHVRL